MHFFSSRFAPVYHLSNTPLTRFEGLLLSPLRGSYLFFVPQKRSDDTERRTPHSEALFTSLRFHIIYLRYLRSAARFEGSPATKFSSGCGRRFLKKPGLCRLRLENDPDPHHLKLREPRSCCAGLRFAPGSLRSPYYLYNPSLRFGLRSLRSLHVTVI